MEKEKFLRISIVVPVYNEKKTIEKIMRAVERAPIFNLQKEIIIVDDNSQDGTKKILEKFTQKHRVIFKTKNEGKGAALKTGFAVAKGDIIIIQDADLEYDPAEYEKLLRPILEDKADVVFGSRFIGGESRRILYYWHSLLNKILTIISNMFSDLNLTDMETCYKVFRKEIINELKIEENRFGFEPEITAKIGHLVKINKIRLYEVGISYFGRTYEEGKKIGVKDAFRSLWCIFKYNNHGFASFVKYGINGIIVAFSQLVFMYTLVEFLHFDSIPRENLANIISIESATIVAFFLHSLITWRQKFENFFVFLRKIFYFHFVNAVTIISRILIFYLLANYLGIGYKLNIAIGIILLIIMNYFAYDKLVFKEETRVTRGDGILEKLLAKKRAKIADSLIPQNLRNGKILDVGCGKFPLFLASIKFKEKIGIEKKIEIKDLKRESIELLEYDIEKEKLPFESDSFETVTMLATIEHFEPNVLGKILEEVKRVLKSEGIFVFTTPAKLTRGILRAMSFLGLVSKEEINEHKKQYNTIELKKILKKAGFKSQNIKIGYFEFFMNIYGRIKK